MSFPDLHFEETKGQKITGWIIVIFGMMFVVALLIATAPTIIGGMLACLGS